MFFRKDYAAPGPGVNPDEPEKTGVARFVEIVSLECVTLVKLNLLFLVSCVFVVTIPAAVFAMNHVVRMMILDQPVICLYHYKTALKRYWKRGYAAFFITAVPLAVSACGMWFYLSRAMENFLLFLPFMLCSTVFLLTLLASTYFYGLLTTERSVGECLRLALLLGAGRPLRAVLAALSVYGMLLAAVLEFPLSGIYLILAGFSLPCLLGGFFVRTELKRFCEEGGSANASGVDYYPEQWDPALMDADLDAIADLGCNVIRIAEFAWHLMEPAEGQYDFSFFDTVISKARARGISVILGTPTAAIPAWLARKHPEILAEFEGGRKRAFGGRHVCCYNSPVLYEYSEKMIRRMVEHYRDEPQVAAWQADNELGHEGSDLCWCPRCRSAFQKYLERKFHGDINALNQTYGTAFWSQEYNGFDEIPLPEETITTHNPALRLDWERFRSRSIEDFLAFQVRLIKEIAPSARVTHDFPGGGLDKHVDYAAAARPLDIVSYNNYPVWGGQKEPLPPHEIAFGLDYIRGLKRQNFWITEAIMGAQGHDVIGYLPRPNQAKLWSYQAMAHGCEALLYFRYRGAAKGAEQFCYGILDADNRCGRKFREVQSFFSHIRHYEKALAAPIQGEVAIVYDYDSLAAFRVQRQSVLLDCQAEMKKLYKPFYDRNVPVDVIPAEADLSRYQVVVLPQMLLTKAAFQARVRAFVESGGTLVLTYRTAVKDGDNNLPFGAAVPVGFRELSGVTVEETESLQDAFPLTGQGAFQGRTGRGGIFRDMLSVQDAEVLYRYGDPFYQDCAAVTRRRQDGGGTVYYLGCGLDEETAAGLMEAVLKERGIACVPTPEGVEAVLRGTGSHRIRMLLNHNAGAVRVGERELPPYGCEIEHLLIRIRTRG